MNIEGTDAHLKDDSKALSKDAEQAIQITTDSERQEAEQRLINREALYNRLEHNLTDVVWIMDLHQRFIRVSPSINQVMGYTVEESYNLTIEEVMTPASYQKVLQTFDEMDEEIKGQKNPQWTKTLELEQIRKDGRIIWVEVKVNLLCDAEGIPDGILGITRDITEHKQAEEALRTSENLLSSIIEQSPFSTWIADANGTNIRQNAACRRLLGIDKDEQTVGKYNLFADPLLKEQGHIKKIKKVFSEGKTAKFITAYDLSKVTHVDVPDAAEKFLLVTIFPITDANGKVINAVVQHEDITEQRKTGTAILTRLNYEKELAACSKALLANVPAKTALDNALRHLLLAAGACRAYIYENFEDPIDGLCVCQTNEACIEGIQPQIDNPFLRQASYIPRWKDELSQGNPIIGIVDSLPEEERLMLKSMDVLSVLVLPIEVKGQWYGFIGFADCLTPQQWMEDDICLLRTGAEMIGAYIERNQAEKALWASEKQYRELIESAHEGIWKIDAHGNTTFANPRMADMLGYTADEMLGRNVFSFANEQDKEIIGQQLERRSRGIVERFNFEFIQKNGEKLYTNLIASPIMDEDGNYMGATAFVTDITEQKKLEAQLRQSHRLEAVGALAGGIAHEFKNLLMGVSGYAEILQMKLGSDHPQFTTTNDLLHCVDRASKLIGQLQAFSKRQIIEPCPTDLNKLMTESKNLLDRLVGEHISIEWNLGKDINIVSVDPGQIEQVLLNLAINARDAMPQGGQITVTTRNRSLKDVDKKKHPWLRIGEYVELSVSDTGVGMDDETIERIFEPFFSTKDKQDRSGLGLAVVYGIIKQHKGYICVFSELGKGTTFQVYLPVTQAESGSDQKIQTPAPTKGNETVLLAEDEEMVRVPAKSVLEEYGYKVLCACDGDEAFELFKQHSDEIDIVILDFIMPKLSGKHVWQEMKKIRPDLKVIFISGYKAAALRKDSASLPDAPFLSKPFSLIELARKVRALLDE